MIEANDALRGALRYLRPKTHMQILPALRETRGPAKPPSEEEVLAEIRAATGVHPVVKESAESASAEADVSEPAAAVGMPGSNPYSS